MSVHERVFQDRIDVAQNSRDQAANGICNNHCGKLSTAQNIVANRDLLIHQMIRYTLIDPFIAAADEKNMLVFCEPFAADWSSLSP